MGRGGRIAVFVIVGVAVALAVVGVGLLAPATQAGAVAAPVAAADADSGVVICGVVSGGPAATAGLKRGDILLTIDGQAVDTVAELLRVVRGHKAGDRMSLSVQHGDEQRTLSVTVGERDGAAYLGVTPCVPLSGPLARLAPLFEGQPFGRPGERPGTPEMPEFRFDLPGVGVQQGAVIREAVEGGPAAAAGLKEGEVITAVDGQKLSGPNGLGEVIAAHKPGDTVALTVRGESASDGEREVKVTLGENPDKAGAAYLGVRYGWIVVQRRSSEDGDRPELPDLRRFFDRDWLPFRDRPRSPDRPSAESLM